MPSLMESCEKPKQISSTLTPPVLGVAAGYPPGGGGSVEPEKSSTFDPGWLAEVVVAPVVLLSGWAVPLLSGVVVVPVTGEKTGGHNSKSCCHLLPTVNATLTCLLMMTMVMLMDLSSFKSER
jgi:hypothetical protein